MLDLLRPSSVYGSPSRDRKLACPGGVSVIRKKTPHPPNPGINQQQLVMMYSAAPANPAANTNRNHMQGTHPQSDITKLRDRIQQGG